MNETELESLVVRLTGDGSEYSRMLQQAQVQSAQTAQQIQAATSRIEAMGAGITSFAQNAVSGLAALGAASILNQAGAIWDAREQSMIRMSATLRSNGRDVAAVTQEYRDFARQIAETTTLGGGEVMSLLRQAETFGLTGGAAQDAALKAIALAAVNEGAAESYLRFTAAMVEGNTEQMKHMARMIPQLRGITNDTELLARAQQLVNTGTETAFELGSTNNAEVERAHRAYKAFLGDIGQVMDDILVPYATALRTAAEWFRAIPKEGKMVIAVVLGIATAMAAIPPIILLAGTIFNTMFGGIGILVGVIATGAVALVAWISGLGGIKESWEAVTTAAMGFWEWIKPTFDAGKAWLIGIWQRFSAASTTAWAWISQKAAQAWRLVQGLTMAFVAWVTPYWISTVAFLGKAWDWIVETAVVVWDKTSAAVSGFVAWAGPIFLAFVGYTSGLWEFFKLAASNAWTFIKTAAIGTWTVLKTVFSSIWDYVTEVWKGIVGDTETSWDDIQGFIVRSFITSEFALRNFGDVAEYVWVATKLGFVSLSNDIAYFFTDQIPALLSNFSTNWRSWLRAIFYYSSGVWVDLTSNIVRLMANLPGLIAGTTDFREVWTPLTRELDILLASLPNMPRRAMSGLERQLTADFERLGSNLGESFDTFMARRLEEIDSFRLPTFQTTPEERNAAEEAGRQLGESFATGAGKGLDKFDAVLKHSAEALARFTEFKDIAFGRVLPKSGEGGGGGRGQAQAGGTAQSRDTVTRQTADRLIADIAPGSSGGSSARSSASPVVVVVPQSTAENPQDRVVNALERIRQELVAANARPTITVIGLSLN